MDDFLTEQDCAPNMNSATIAGKVIKVEALKGKSVGISFVVGYQKHWPSGGTQEIPMRCYATGQERIGKLNWLQMGEIVLISGEVTDKGSVYSYQVQQLSRPKRVPGEGDEYLAALHFDWWCRGCHNLRTFGSQRLRFLKLRPLVLGKIMTALREPLLFPAGRRCYPWS